MSNVFISEQVVFLFFSRFVSVGCRRISYVATFFSSDLWEIQFSKAYFLISLYHLRGGLPTLCHSFQGRYLVILPLYFELCLANGPAHFHLEEHIRLVISWTLVACLMDH